ncbi:MAG: hypothetical protein JXA14_23005 [Anaerolineae bacterium]|nr:hypothetical protein [Anaerolineae bacterium]
MTKMHYLRGYIRWRFHYHRARRQLRKTNPDTVAAHAMFHLNHVARQEGRSPRRRYIYALKNRLLEHFCRAGFCTSVSLQVQTLYCHDCGGTGNYYDHGDCWRCDGTGVYARHALYRFTFDVHGTRYTWHQPQRLVTWPVVLTDEEPGVYTDAISSSQEPLPDRRDVELYYVTLYAYLLQRGLLGDVLREDLIRPRLCESLRRDLQCLLIGNRYYRWYRWKARPRLRQLRRAIVGWWRTGYVDLAGFLEEDEIPF